MKGTMGRVCFLVLALVGALICAQSSAEAASILSHSTRGLLQEVDVVPSTEDLAEPTPAATAVTPEEAAVDAAAAANITEQVPAAEAAGGLPGPFFYSYLYLWCAQTNVASCTNDFMAVVDAHPLSQRFGQVLKTVDAPWCGTEPHHAGLSADKKWLVGGGLLSFLAGAPDIAVFSTANPASPRFSHNVTGRFSHGTDEFLPLPGGGFLVTQMAAADGSSPGRVLKLNPSMQYAGEFPSTLDPAKTSKMNPHGIAIDLKTNKMVTCDFLEITSAVAGPLVVRATARIWNFATMTIEKVVTISDPPTGSMDVKFITGSKGLFLITSGAGSLYTLNALTGTIQRSYCLRSDCTPVPTFCIIAGPFAGNKRVLVASHATNEVRLLDISNPWRLRTVQTQTLQPVGAPQAGAHMIKIELKTGIMAMSTYFVSVPGTVVDLPGDQTLRFFRFTANSIREIKVVDTKTAFLSTKGSAKCHGFAFNTR